VKSPVNTFPMETTTMTATLGSTFEVWHKATPTFLDNTAAALAAFPEGFTHVADVVTDDVGRVFELTNTIDRGWWENPEVTLTPEVAAKGGARSTSVGDVIVKALAVRVGVDGVPVWARWSVEGIGLKKF
jgi:hypothetical protein